MSKYLSDEELFTSDKNKWGIDLTEDEIDLLAKIVWLECRGESDKGQRAVIEVVLNRMIYKKYFSTTLNGVLGDKGEFTTWDDRNNAEPTEKEYDNIHRVLNDETNILGFEAIYFFYVGKK